MQPMNRDAGLARVMARTIAKDGCLEWQGAHNQRGYGLLLHEGKRWVASRLVWACTNGPIPEGLFVCHSCDNPPCCNPAHLFLGTAKDNVRDMMAKGRRRAMYGEALNRQCLTNATAQEVRTLCASGLAPDDVAQAVGVSVHVVRSVKNGRTWRHLDGGKRIPNPPQSATGFRGVSYETSTGRYRVSLRVDGRMIRQRVSCPEQGARLYDQWVRAHRGPEAPTNFPECRP